MSHKKESIPDNATDLLYGSGEICACPECGKLNTPDYNIREGGYLKSRYTCSECNHKYQTYYSDEETK